MRQPTPFAIAGALLAALSAPAAAWDPRLPVLGAEPGAEDKLARFRLAHRGDAPLQAALEAGVQAGIEPRDRIHAALLATQPEYAAAYAGWERSGDNVDAWRTLLSRLDKEQLHLKAHATYLLGRALLARDELEGAAAALDAVRGRLRLETPWSDEATLWLAFAFARMPDGGPSNTARARQLLESLLPDGAACDYPDAPERVVEGARWLLRELRGEGLGPLLELAKRMETIERMIRRSETGQPTRKRQEEVILTLDKLIELMREKEQSGGGKGQGQGQGKGGQQPGPGGPTPGGTQQPGGPAQQSQLPGGPSREGPLAEGRRDPTGEEWGNLRDAEREEAAQFLRERFPARYREILERYYRALAEEDR